jgi:hypothetical protein
MDEDEDEETEEEETPLPVSYPHISLAAPLAPAIFPAVLSCNHCIKSGLALCGGLPTWWRTKVDSGASRFGVFGDVRNRLVPEIANLFSLDVSNYQTRS